VRVEIPETCYGLENWIALCQFLNDSDAHPDQHPFLCIRQPYLTKRQLPVLAQIVIFHSRTVQHLDIIKVFLFTNWCTSECLKNNIKIYIKTAPTCFSAVTPSLGSALSVLAKVTVVKIANYGTSVCDKFGVDVAAYTGSVLVGVFMLSCSDVISRCTVRMWKF
jgi:hypothetical protein